MPDETPMTDKLRAEWDVYWNDQTATIPTPEEPFDLCEKLERELATMTEKYERLNGSYKGAEQRRMSAEGQAQGLRDQLAAAFKANERLRADIQDMVNKAEGQAQELRDQLAAALKAKEKAERLNKNLAPTGRYEGLDIEGWYRRAVEAEQELEMLARLIDCARTGDLASVRALASLDMMGFIVPRAVAELQKRKENQP